MANAIPIVNKKLTHIKILMIMGHFQNKLGKWSFHACVSGLVSDKRKPWARLDIPFQTWAYACAEASRGKDAKLSALVSLLEIRGFPRLAL